jgi:polar amino acid transport system substrate-binding protein
MFAATILASILPLASLQAPSATADAAPVAEAAPLRVGIAENRPFAWIDARGRWLGYSLQLWDEICEAERVPYTLVPYATVGDLIHGIERGEVDAAALATAPTVKRLGLLEFTIPFELSNICIASRIDRRATVLGLLEHLVAPPLPFIYLMVLFTVLALAIVVRTVERWGEHREHLGHPDSPFSESIWWAAVTFFTVGYGDLVPKTRIGRALTVLAMVVSAILLSLMTGAVSSAITVRNLRGVSAGPEDLDRMTCGVAEGTATHDWAERYGIKTIEFPTLEKAIGALREGKVEAVLGEGISLRDAIDEPSPDGLVVDEVRFTRKSLSFPLRLGFPEDLRRRLNRRILDISDSQAWRRSIEQDLGVEDGP